MTPDTQLRRALLLVKVAHEPEFSELPSLADFDAQVAALRNDKDKLELYLARVQRTAESGTTLLEYLKTGQSPYGNLILEKVDEEWRKLIPTSEEQEIDSPNWPLLQDAHGNSKWGPLVQFLAKAMVENRGASRAELANHFAIVCERYPDAKLYCDNHRVDPASIHPDTLGKLRQKADGFLARLDPIRLKSDR